MMNTVECKGCPWKKLAVKRGWLLDARLKKDGRAAMKLHEDVKELEAEINESETRLE